MAKNQSTTLETADGPMALYEAFPNGDARAAVIVIQEAFGVNEHIEDVTRRLAAEGYHAVAPALYHRSSGATTAPYDDFDQIMPLFQSVSDEGTLVDIDATLEHLRAAGWPEPRIGIVGFCMGGRVSFLIAARRRLGASVSFYGGGIVSARPPGRPPLIGEADGLTTPWLGLFGDLDEGIPIEDVETLRVAVEKAPAATEIVRYPDADHGFYCDERPVYHEKAAADAWRRTLAWFAARLPA